MVNIYEIDIRILKR